ncbi:metallophosphoesterase family protein [Candidatus Skiveiella danica]|uniref:metallophosphoesterase family protein n=1 Tax=Candidatus Skiveiella danica TaxID=3386177 RepID=UPI0039B9696F
MKLALLSDIHANLQAFDACLAHAQAVAHTRYALLSDLVGYGADPVAVVQRVIQMAGEGAIVLKGNHDEMAVMPDGANKTLGGTADCTHAQLDAAQRAYLYALPLTHREDTTLLVHASVDSPGAGATWTTGAAPVPVWMPAPTNRACTMSSVAMCISRCCTTVAPGVDLQKFAPTPGVPVPMPPAPPMGGHHRLRGPAARRRPAGHVRPVRHVAAQFFTACPMTTNRRPPSGRPDARNTLPNAWRMDVETAGTWSRTGRICH